MSISVSTPIVGGTAWVWPRWIALRWIGSVRRWVSYSTTIVSTVGRWGVKIKLYYRNVILVNTLDEATKLTSTRTVTFHIIDPSLRNTAHIESDCQWKAHGKHSMTARVCII